MKLDTPYRTPRSHHLRRQAQHVHPLLATAYRRRASEVELQEWLTGVVAPTASN